MSTPEENPGASGSEDQQNADAKPAESAESTKPSDKPQEENTTPQPAKKIQSSTQKEVAKATKNTSNANDTTPFQDTISWVRKSAAGIGAGTFEFLKGTKEGSDKVLGAEEKAPVADRYFIPKTVGDAADATATPLRRSTEILYPTAVAAHAATGLATRLLFHPFKSFRNPIKNLWPYIKQAVAAPFQLAHSLINFLPKSADEIVNRGIEKPLSRIPGVEKGTKWLGWLPRQITKLGKGLVGGITKPLNSFFKSAEKTYEKRALAE